MGNLKIGKQPKNKWRRPSATSLEYLDKKSLEEVSNRKSQFNYKWERAQALQLPESPPFVMEGVDTVGQSVGIYLDDERPCPEDWTLARTSKQFFELLDNQSEETRPIEYISLDWYLGSRDIDGVEVAKRLAEKFLEANYNDAQYLPHLKAIGFHSSDSQQARRMADIMKETLEHCERLDGIRLRLRTPSLR